MSEIDDSESASDRSGRMRAHARALVGDGQGVDDDAGLPDALERLCVTAATELLLSAAVLTLMAGDGSEAVAGASDGHARGLEEIRFTIGEGPGCDAFAAARPVLIPDLESAFVRWPGYVPDAVRAGVRASYCFPLQLGAMRFGVLSLYAGEVRTLTAPELTQCLVFAEIATELLLESTTRGSVATASRGLTEALKLRSETYQAQGMVMVALDISLVEALARMRAHAFTLGTDLPTLATGILAGTIDLNGTEAS